MTTDQKLRDQLTKLLQGGQAFTPFEQVLQGLTAEEAGTPVPDLPYTTWQLLEHVRIALCDILEFSRDPNYVSPKWPEDYWTDAPAPPDEAALATTIQAVKDGVAAMVALVQDPGNDLFEPFAHGDGQNLLREALLVAEHNAYHVGQIVVLRRLLGQWE